MYLTITSDVKEASAKVEQKKKNGKNNDGGEDEEETNESSNRWGMGGINRPLMRVQNRYYSYCPIHIACEKGHLVSTDHLPYLQYLGRLRVISLTLAIVVTILIMCARYACDCLF